jgi:hypothetical protein
LLALSGCNSLPSLKEVPVAPPAQYLENTDEPLFVDPTNGGLALYATDLKIALGVCNADKAAVRDWVTLAVPLTKKEHE